MIKTGITRINDITSNHDKTFLLKSIKNISLALYDQAVQGAYPTKVVERILLQFTDDRGVYKRTYNKRFKVFDTNALDVLKIRFNKPDPLLVHDVGVSDGRTAVDFFKSLSTIFPSIKFKASDYSPKVHILEHKKIKIVLSSNGKPLQITYPPFVFNVIKQNTISEGFLYPINYIIFMLLQAFVVKPLLKQYKLKKIRSKELLLFSPEAITLAKNEPNFRLDQYNLLSMTEDKYNVVRAMNILNPHYFSEAEFSIVMKNIHSQLLPNGLLISGSNQNNDTLVHGGIYEKTPKGFNKIWQSGDGHPIERYILNMSQS